MKMKTLEMMNEFQMNEKKSFLHRSRMNDEVKMKIMKTRILEMMNEFQMNEKTSFHHR